MNVVSSSLKINKIQGSGKKKSYFFAGSTSATLNTNVALILVTSQLSNICLVK